MALLSEKLRCRAGAEPRKQADDTALAAEKVVPLPSTDSEGQPLDELLRKCEQKRRALLSTVSELVFVLAKDGTILEFYAQADNDLMLSAEGLVGRNVKQMLPTPIGQQVMYYVEKTLRTGQTQVTSHQFQLATGLRHYEARLAVYDAGQIVALVRDVTDRDYLEKEILEISNREQMRIGQDLHDGLGQHLTGITFLAKALERKLAQLSLPEAVEAGEINRLVMQALAQTRSLARGLFPVELEVKGLIPAFRELADQVKQMCDISCAVECDEHAEVRDRVMALHLFRLAQEAVSNAVRHGKAKHVRISFRASGGNSELTIQDDGQGFRSEGAQLKGLGLRIMTYRAQRIGGRLDIRPSAEGGTVVTCRFAAGQQKVEPNKP